MILPCSCESDRESGMRVCLPPIAIDAAPPPREFSLATDGAASSASEIPVLKLPKFAERFLQPSRAALAEADYVRSLYEGVTHGEGRKRHEEYLRAKFIARSVRP
jgi:hypothetical protein